MTISIKPTASGSTIEQDGSTILTVDGSGNLSTPNNLTVTGTINGDGSGLTGVSSTNVLNAEIIYWSNSEVNGGTTYVNGYSDFRYASGMDISGTHTKQSATSDIVLFSLYNCRNTSGNFHAMGVWCDAGNTASLFHINYFDPYYWQQNRPMFSNMTRFTGLATGSHTYHVAAGRGDASNSTGTVNSNPNSAHAPAINGNSYTMLYVMEVE